MRRQHVLPKVNHRLRSFKGLRSWMVDFLGGDGGVAWGMRPATCGMWQAAVWGAWGLRPVVCGRRQLVLPKVNHRLRSFNGLRPWMVDFWVGTAVWRQLVLPKVNHRLRSFNGLRPWMVDFLGGGGSVAAVRAAKSQPSPFWAAEGRSNLTPADKTARASCSTR